MGKLPPHLHRSGCGIELVDNKLIFIGGMDPEQQQMNLVIIYILSSHPNGPFIIANQNFCESFRCGRMV